MLKLFGGFRCRLAGTFVEFNDTRGNYIGKRDIMQSNPQSKHAIARSVLLPSEYNGCAIPFFAKVYVCTFVLRVLSVCMVFAVWGPCFTFESAKDA